ncbi:MAG: hypothetical protein LBO00_05630 [Zoogloeaceae bacterium]|nr:hypothetical protein [Zoogloeaceae bacterium]
METFLARVRGQESQLVLFLSSPEVGILDFHVDIKKRIFLDGCCITQTFPSWSCPEYFFLSSDSLTVFGENFVVPKNHENYLSFLYGNWKVKRNDWKFSEYAGSKIVCRGLRRTLRN